MKNFKLVVFSLIFSTFFASSFLFFSGNSSAQGVQDFVINNFDAQYNLTREDPQGTLNIIETIDLDFSGQNRGILRAIPAKYKGNSLSVSIESVKRDDKVESYITYEESDNLILRIGDPDVFLSGKHKYEIKYKLVNVISFYEDKDELYWDINGDQWQQVFENVNVTLRFEAPQVSEPKPVCFTGAFRSAEQICSVNQEPVKVETKTTAPLRPSETLTIVQNFEKGYFTPPSWTEKNFGLIVASPLILLQALIAFTAYNWYLQA
jgi:hypothetical protein